MSAAPKERQPWPMKWIVLAIVLTVVPYTIITLRYRKPGPAFEPYADMKNRANVVRLLAAGYQRIPLPATRPADGPSPTGGASILPDAAGVPAELKSTLVEPPLLPAEIRRINAAPSIEATAPYPIELTCVLPDDRHQLAGADLYLREDRAVIVPTFEPAGTSLVARSGEAVVLLTVPAGAFKPGRYNVTVAGERASRSWPLEVR
jgi:hypothetical protein